MVEPMVGSELGWIDVDGSKEVEGVVDGALEGITEGLLEGAELGRRLGA